MNKLHVIKTSLSTPAEGYINSSWGGFIKNHKKNDFYSNYCLFCQGLLVLLETEACMFLENFQLLHVFPTDVKEISASCDSFIVRSR